MLLEWDLPHLRSHRGLPEDARWFFELAGVSSARATSYAIWPGPFELPKDVSRDEEARLVREYQSKWREESIDWNDLEALVNQVGLAIEIHWAEMANGPETVAMHLSGDLEGGDSSAALTYEIFLRASVLTCRNSTGTSLSLDEFIGMGSAYWEAFEQP
jgi:hypothetical protein